ncbi:MAG TPA: 30S ribosomal protein S16 [Actinomycetota bacterium]|nr:30S ribosomal protein S16 [Actinomycetota bacterium]
MVKIRLMRMGAKKRPFFRVVVADSRSPRDGRFIENIGKYHPLEHPSLIEIDEERAMHWLQNGAQPTQPVRVLLEKTGVWDRFEGGPGTPVPPPPDEEKPSKKAQAAAEAEAQEPAEEAPAEEAPAEEAPAEEAPAEEAPAEEAPAEEAQAEPEAEAEEAPAEEAEEKPE